MNTILRIRTVLGAGVMAVVTVLGGCSTAFPLMPTPMLYTGGDGKPLFTGVAAEREVPALELLYVTDRQRSTAPDDPLPYSAERARSMAFGRVIVEFGKDLTWNELATLSLQGDRPKSLDLELGPVKELGRFPYVPYDIKDMPTGISRDPAVIDAHESAKAALQAEVARQLLVSPRKEVVLFVHGYANTFRDAALTMGELCHFLGREFACAIFSWPAGGSRGLFFGYNVDRESGEFAVLDLKRAIRIIAGTPGVERVHLVAHSRGTDVLSTALAQLSIEAYAVKSSVAARFKIANIVLMAPDIDADVAAVKVFSVLSDPDLPHGDTSNPRGILPPAAARLTVYVSPDDKALSFSKWLFGSLQRLGRTDVGELSQGVIERLRRMQVVDLVQVSGTTDTFGHSYLTSNPEVSTDLIAMIRFGLKPGDPGRPLVEVERPVWKVIQRDKGAAAH